ncbi:MAG TPA: nicotinamide-nucleotide amidohydrolase family protein [Pseudonocardiaceae bacterium]|nr:nicotinamide-nucleotide amidohydrolase family protein [Pseudonocardiaceae bacterium]
MTDAGTVVRLLVERGQTVATAESLTAGLVTATLTTVPGSSAVVRGGLVVYATDLKATLAGVPADLLARHGAVHPDVAAALAEGARLRCGADWGVGLTGVAGPDPQDGVAPGRVYLSIAGPDGGTGYRLDLCGDREAVRAASVAAAIDALHTALTG